MQSDDNLIVIKKSSIKEKGAKLFIKGLDIYTTFYVTTLTFWLKVFSNENRIKILLQSEPWALFFNTLLCATVGTILGGLISQILLAFTVLNILVFCLKKLSWYEKSKKILEN